MNSDALSSVLWNVFVTHTTDICPTEPKHYQAIFFNTSGIDVFMERLAFLARLVKSGKITTDKLIVLVGQHAHRQDLKDPNYLAQLPCLFDQEFNLCAYDKTRALESLADLLQKDAWLHKDGMIAVWRLIRCDKTMANLEKQFSFFPQDNPENLRTEQILQRIREILDQPLDHDHAIVFICNAQGAAKTIDMIDKLFPDCREYIDILVAKSVPSDKEGKLFNDTPQQRAMTKLFHLYRILEARYHN